MFSILLKFQNSKQKKYQNVLFCCPSRFSFCFLFVLERWYSNLEFNPAEKSLCIILLFAIVVFGSSCVLCLLISTKIVHRIYLLRKLRSHHFNRKLFLFVFSLVSHKFSLQYYRLLDTLNFLIYIKAFLSHWSNIRLSWSFLEL